MKIYYRFCISFIIVFLLMFTNSFAQTYHNYNELTNSLKKLNKDNQAFINLESIGKSKQNKDLWLVTIANKKGKPINERPALLIVANLEADHLFGSEMALSTIKYFMDNYSSNSQLKKVIDENTIYIIPRLNPDGAELAFESVKTGLRTNLNSFDNDNDGRLDEDGAEDLNKDGQITFMRVKDPMGLYMIDPKDNRLMKKADSKKGEKGEFSIYWEGIDNDGDGFINEDPKGGVDLNRNFQHEYPYYSQNAGLHMISENESKALMDWLLKNKNVAAILTYGLSDNLIIAPNDKGKLSTDRELNIINFANESFSEANKMGMFSKNRRDFNFERRFRGEDNREINQSRRPARLPVTDYNISDLEYFKTISDKYKELTKIKKQPVVRTPKGAFFQYGYFQFGVPSFSTPAGGFEFAEDNKTQEKPRSENQSREANVDKELLTWLDQNNPSAFINWKNFNHSELGELEIGGFAPYNIANPPASFIENLGKQHAEFSLYLATLFPKIKIAKTEIKNHGGGIFSIKAEIENEGFLPTSLEQGVVSRSVKPTMVQLGVKPDQIITGNPKTNFIAKLDGSGKRAKFEWLVNAKSGDKIELKVVSEKGGNDTAILILK